MPLGREYRVILWLVLALGVFVVLGYLRYWTAPDTRQLDTIAAHKIEEFCGYRPECKVKLGDLFEGDWDHLYVLGSNVGQAEADELLGAAKIKVTGADWTLILMHGNRVVATQAASDSAKIEFLDEHHRDRRTLQATHEDWVWANRYHRPAGDYYVLGPDDR